MLATTILGEGLTLEIEYTQTLNPPEADGRDPYIEFDIESVKINGVEVDPEWGEYLCQYYFTFIHTQK